MVRDGSVDAQTRKIMHYFDCPYQLGDGRPDRSSGGTVLRTKLVKVGIVLSRTDGMFNSLINQHICKVVASRIILNPSNIAWSIAKKLRAVYLDDEAKIPYTKLDQKNRYRSTGTGWEEKVDNISCIVLRIK